MQKTKIDWCDFVWNPVWGCLNKCEYCYAKKIAKRFWKQILEKEIDHLDKNNLIENNFQLYWLEACLKEFKPVFLYSNYDKPFPKKPSRIFVNSMSDIAFWTQDWMIDVLNKIRRHPEHIFLFLTKLPRIYEQYDFPKNCWLGITITYGERGDIILKRTNNSNIKFISLNHY